MSEITVNKIHVSKDGELVIYMALVESELYYLVTTKHPEFKHWCGYVNLSKEDWRAVSDRVIRRWPISYEGIGSSILTIPNKILAVIPLAMSNYWVGLDWMGHKDVDETDVVERLVDLCLAIQAAKRGE